MPVSSEIDLYNRSERLLTIHYSALIVPDSVRVRKDIARNRQAYRIWRMEDPIQVTLRDNFCQQVFEALEGAVISQDYFRRELPFGHCRDRWGSWLNNEAEVDVEAENTYDISLPKRKFGVFDSTGGPLVEARYLIQEVPWKITVGTFMAVNPDEWLKHAIEVGTPLEAVTRQLEAQRSVRVKAELPITTPSA